jgi:hypothetical protein
MLPRSCKRTPMRKWRSSVALQIEYVRRTSCPSIVARTPMCCPGANRKASRSSSGTSRVTQTASLPSGRTSAMVKG